MMVSAVLSASTKLRVLHRLRKIAPAWAMRQQAAVVERAFDIDIAKAKSLEEREVVASQRYFESSEYWGALAELRTNKLLDRARKHYLIPEGMEWTTDGFANRYLDNASLSNLNKLVVEETRKHWEFRLKVIGGVIAVLTGLVGAIIGLVAMWKRK
jgi:hypothetical protein